jgi:hypothetical protein
MNNIDLKVSVSLAEAEEIIYDTIVNGSISGELVDRYVVNNPDNTICIVNVYERLYYRAGRRFSLTVVYDNVCGYTRIHAVSSGRTQSIFKFDFGAAGNFASSVYTDLRVLYLPETIT